jgi:GNAT superfamily N-acetyltransferase
VRPRHVHATGLTYLQLVTQLLQSARLSSPTGGIWEAADFQWWWRLDQHPRPEHQVIWLEGAVPRAASIVTHWRGRVTCDVISSDQSFADVAELVWPTVLGQIESLGDQPVIMTVNEDDTELVTRVTAAGFQPTDEVGVETWMPAGDAALPHALPEGFELVSRNDARGPHHLCRRNGPDVADRLDECSLYRRRLDLAVYAPGGDVASYGVFWADPVTGVGLVEPMRTEDTYQGLGLARHVLGAGLGLLAGSGCSRLKVTYIVGNEASRRLYLGAGFHPVSSSRTYERRSGVARG